MNLLIEYNKLNAALTMVSRAAHTSSVQPIIANVAMQTKGNRLYMKCNNLEFGIETFAECEVTEQGEVTINATLFKNYIARLPKDTGLVHLDLNKQNLRLKIEVPGNEAEAVNINGISISEFPMSPVNVLAHTITMLGESLKSSVNKVAYAAGANQNYMTTTCVRFLLTETESTLCASDGNRLAYLMFTPMTPLPQGRQYELLVPAKALQELSAVLPTDEIVEVGPNSNMSYIIFKWNGAFCYINLIEGTFPKLEKFIEFETVTKMTIDKHILEEKLTDISVLSRSEADTVSINTESDKGLVKLFTAIEMVSDINRILNATDVTGPNQSTMASIKLLREALKSINCPDIILEFRQSPMPQIVFGPYSDEYKKQIAIVMPKYSN